MFDMLFDDFIYFCLGPGIVCNLRVWGFYVHSAEYFGLTLITSQNDTHLNCGLLTVKRGKMTEVSLQMD